MFDDIPATEKEGIDSLSPGDHIVITGGTHKGKRAQFLARCPKFLKVSVDNWAGTTTTTVRPHNVSKTTMLHEIFLDTQETSKDQKEAMSEAATDPEFIVLVLQIQRVLDFHDLENKGSIVGQLFNRVAATYKEEAYFCGSNKETDHGEGYYDTF